MKNFSQTLYEGITNQIKKNKMKQDVIILNFHLIYLFNYVKRYFMKCKTKNANTKNNFKKKLNNFLIQINEKQAKLENFILTWISYAFKQDDEPVTQNDDEEGEVRKSANINVMKEVFENVMFGENKSKKAELFSQNPGYLACKSKNRKIGIIDENNITPEQKKSMNIWMHILNMNLKKATFDKISLNQLENYDYHDVMMILIKFLKCIILQNRHIWIYSINMPNILAKKKAKITLS